jgi:predicted deacetylase
MAQPKLLVALHDVTPVHAARLEKAERLLTALGIRRVTYLLVPDFHASGAAHASDAFVAWCRMARPFDVQWFLHGYFHKDVVASARRLNAADWLASKLLTAGEGEFLELRGDALRERIGAGVQSFERCLGDAPSGFVAPAWLFNSELIPALTNMSFQFTESHFRVFHLRTGRERTAPVITWATRTRLRRYGSLIVALAERRLWQAQPLLRVALHPYDFDHPATVASIARTLDAVRRDRVLATYDDSLFD